VLFATQRRAACIFLRVVGMLFVPATLFFPDTGDAQQLDLVISPVRKPSVASRFLRFPPFSLDRTSLKLGAIQGGAELYDGITTRYFVHHCKSCVESDPMSRLLLGPKPAWKNMIAFGSIEAVATSYLHQRMSHSSNEFVRRMAPWVPLAIIGVHIVEGTRNVIVIPSPRSRRIQPLH
jgi:hypothetical protein